MNITRKQLEVFIAVAESGQIKRASRRVSLTPPAVSMALSEMENQLGGVLFERGGRSFILNAHGRYMLPVAKSIVAKVANIENVMSVSGELFSGTIHVAATETLGAYVLPYLIGAFTKIHPKVEVKLSVGDLESVEHAILHNRAQLGFVEGGLQENVNLFWKPWFEDELIILCSVLDSLADQDSFDIQRDINGSCWIMPEPGSDIARAIEEKLGSHLKNGDVIMELPFQEAIKRAVECNLGIACLSSLACGKEEQSGCLKRLKVTGLNMKRELKTIHHRELEMSLAMNEFLAFCDIMALCDDPSQLLASPAKLQTFVSTYSHFRKN